MRVAQRYSWGTAVMLQGPIFLGIGFLLFGLVFFVLVWVLLRFVPGVHSTVQEPLALPAAGTQSHNDAILVIETGGRIRYINEVTRNWFELLDGELPNIERLGRKVRPVEGFLEICALEGLMRFSVNGRLVDAVSYRIPGQIPAIVVALREAENTRSLSQGGQEGLPGPALKSVSEFGQLIASSLSLESTTESILVNVEQLVASDFIEVKAWDEATQTLVPFRLEGSIGSVRTLQHDKPSQFGEYANSLVASRKELFISDTRMFAADKFDSRLHNLPAMGSYIGMPLIAYGQLVGTLEVGVMPVKGFSGDDLSILQMIAGPAAVAMRNASLYEAQQRWNAQLFGLTNLSQAISSLRDLKDLFTRMVDGLSPLFNVEILGFLLYDDQRHTLEGQIPFQGLPDNIVQLYKMQVRPNSPAEKRILTPEIINTSNATRDLALADLGLQDLAQAASMRDTVLAPLVSAEHFLGYLQLSNHRKGESPNSPEELRLLNIVASQVSAIIENALLVQQARQRNQRTEAMRRIASLVSSSATLDEILHYSIKEVALILQADSSSIFILDESVGVMRAHIPSVFGVLSESMDVLSRLNVKFTSFRLTVAGSQRPFVSGNLARDRRVLPMYRPIVRKLNLESCLVVPLIVRGKGIGELMLGSLKQDFFTNYDLQIAATVASQLAIAIESDRHAGETDATLQRRSGYLTVMNRISRELNSTTNLNELTRLIYDECLLITGASCGTVSLYEPLMPGIELRTVMINFGHHPGGHPLDIIQQALASGEPILISNFAADHKDFHTGVRAALVAPLRYQDETVGVIELHATQPDVFDETSIEMVKNICVQAALAIANALRSVEQQSRVELFRRRADTLMQLFETSKNLRIDQTLLSALDSIAQGIQRATPFNVVLISLYDPKTELLRRIVAVGLDNATFTQVQARPQPWSSVIQLMKTEFEIGNLYFLPFDKAPIIPADLHMVTTMTEAEKKPNAWDPDDLLIIPIYDNEQNPLGLISVDAPRDGLRPDRVTLETLEVFSAQAALTITSGLLIQDYKSQIDSLNQEITRQKTLVGFSQRSLPMLLRKDLEQTLSTSYLTQRARHIRASLQLTEAISRQSDSAAALLTLGQQVLTSFEMSFSIVARDTADGARIVHVLGNLPRGVNPEAFFGQRNPLRVCLQTGETILSVNLDEDEIWHDTPFLTALRAKCFICMPVVVNDKTIAAVMAADTETLPIMSLEDRQVYSQISKQVSITLQNIDLLNETRQRLQEVNLLLDFSRRLSGLSARDIMRALLQSALRVVSSAHAGVVFQWRPHDDLLVPLSAANYVDNASIMGISYHLGEGLPGRAFSEKQPHRVDEVNFAADYILPPENLLRYRKATGGRLPVSNMIIPVSAGERFLGAIILDNFNTPAAFRPDDEAILLSLTQQVALSLENLRLMQSTQERAGQLQALNSVASSLTSSLEREELVGSLLDRMATVIPFDRAILWLRQDVKMVVTEARGFNDNEERKGLTVDVADSVLLNEMTRTGQAIVVDDIRVDSRFTQLVQPDYLAWMGIPLITKGQVIGVIALEKTESFFYTHELMQLSTTFASQAAVAIDNANLFEESIRRAAELDERSQRLVMLNKFSSELGGSLSADKVLRLTANQLMEAVHADRALLLSLGKNNRNLLIAAIPDDGDQPGELKVLPVSPALERLSESQTVYIAEDIRHDQNLASLAGVLVDSSSLLILPVSGRDKLYAIVLQSQHSRRFTSTEIELSRTIGNQAAIALDKADLYQDTLATVDRLAILNEVSYAIGSRLNPDDIYQAVHDAASKLMPVEAFIIALVDDENGDVDAAYVVDLGQRISGVRLPQGQGLSGQVIASGQPILTSQSSEAQSQGGVTIGEQGTPHSIVAVPMFSGGKVVGALSAQSYQYDAYSENDQQILSTLANQATVAILNARLFDQTQKLAANLEQRVVARTAELEHEQHNTETLLRILTEVSSSLDLDRTLSRTLALLNDAIGAEQGIVMLLQVEDNRLYFRAGYGFNIETGEPSQLTTASMPSIKVGEGLAGWVVKQRKPVKVDDLYQDSRWVVTQDSQQYRSALLAPLLVGEDVIGTIMVFHHSPAYFGDDGLEMVKAIGSQVAIAINNAQLYELIRDQAERLGSMLRQQQMEASRQTAILEAVADGVLVTDPSNSIAFVNASAERILSLDESQVKGQSLENFAGLFGKSAHTWIQTVQEWSSEHGNSQAGEMYAEQISLDNGRVALVHLAPVVWRTEFLGTVSIFRDITHEVELDRLKSEFVATVSHELRTPMTSIRGYVDILLMGAAGALNESQSHFLDIVKSNTERLNILVNDLLDVSRIEAGRVMLSLHSIDLGDVADEVVVDVLRRSQEEGKPMDVSIDLEKSLPRVMADPERIRQILGNLVDNAYNYTPAQGRIQICLHKVNGDVQVDVKDSGIGVAIEHQERVFERFFRGEDPLVLATPGTGLGLPIVKQLVEMHHGKIWMKSAGIPGYGSTFSITLPIPEIEE
jgi:PAS domain S-box-containing protein